MGSNRPLSSLIPLLPSWCTSRPAAGNGHSSVTECPARPSSELPPPPRTPSRLCEAGDEMLLLWDEETEAQARWEAARSHSSAGLPQGAPCALRMQSGLQGPSQTCHVPASPHRTPASTGAAGPYPQARPPAPPRHTPPMAAPLWLSCPAHHCRPGGGRAGARPEPSWPGQGSYGILQAIGPHARAACGPDASTGWKCGSVGVGSPAPHAAPEGQVWAEVLVGGASRKKRLSRQAVTSGPQRAEVEGDATTRRHSVQEGGWEMTKV